MSKRRVVVTGLGAVTAYGLGVSRFWEGTLGGVARVRPVAAFNPSSYRSVLGAPIADEINNDQTLRKEFSAAREDATFYSCVAVADALEDAGLERDLSGSATGVGCVVATLCGGGRNFDIVERAYDRAGKRVSGLPDNDTLLVDYHLSAVCDTFGFLGPSTLVSTACSSGTDALGWGADQIASGRCERMVVVGGDVITESIHAGFDSVFSITKTTPRPFDRDRDGFVVGEGGGALILETLDAARARGAKVYAEIRGYGLSNSAYHLTAPSKDGSGESLAMRRAIANAGLTSADIDFVNAHGTATAHNDSSEVLAMKAIFADRAPEVSITSIKSMIGHCMGAAGVLEAISTVLTVQTGKMPPTINFRVAEDINDFDVVGDVGRERGVRNAMSNSFGFAGHCSCVVIGSPGATFETSRSVAP